MIFKSCIQVFLKLIVCENLLWQLIVQLSEDRHK